MEVNEKVKKIKSIIASTMKPCYVTTDGKDLRVRCPYCGDSRKNSTSAHMYISLVPPFQFHCFKCESSGVLNATTLKDFKIHNNEAQLNIIEVNKTLKGRNRNIKSTKKKKKLDLYVEYNNQVQSAINYFNSRYESNYSFNDLEYLTTVYKLILDPIQFFNKNKLKVNLDNFFNYETAIGFLSSDSAYIVFRDISGNSSKRYNNCRISDELEGKKEYSIGTEINMLSNNVNLVITEGIFDIIGVYENFYKNSAGDNYIFAAACGKSYMSIINKYLRMGFLNLNITIYSDADVGINFYQDMKRNSDYLKNIPITIYYNDLEKDFGIPSNRIKIRKVVI